MAAKKQKKNQPTRKQRARNAAIAGVLIGAGCGAVIGASFGAAWPTAVTGALLLGLGEGLTDWTRQPAQLKPLPYRIAVAAVFGAAFGSLLGLLFPEINLLLAGGIIGFTSGLFGLYWKRLLLGTATGLVIAMLAALLYPALHSAVLGALIVLIYRILAAWILPSQEAITFTAERVPVEEIPFVVPFEANSNFIGADYFHNLARDEAGDFKRNAPGAGIVETMETMRGPTFDPDQVDPLIREFYEHTTRFKLAITPVWKEWMKPIFWLYKRLIARPMGQANLPFNQEEAQRGVVSYIDTIDFQCNDIIDLRGWVRAFEETGEAIYVGVYTTFRHDERGYVSVGFPLPDSNFTATLLPYYKDGRNFILKSRDTGLPYPGHYLSSKEDGRLTVVALPAFNEEIEVLVEDGRLKTNHRFYLGNQNFLTLFYTIDRAGI